MSYIGNQPTQIAFLTDSFNGNGSTTAFTMSVAPANTASVLVAVSGVLQDPSTYSVSGNTLTFSGAPPSGTGNISARYLGIPASGVTTTAYRTVTEFTATAGQSTFTPPSYTVGFIDVLRNGVRLGSADYTATNGTTVVITGGVVAGDLITTISFYVSSVLNAIPATAGSVSDSYIVGMSASKLTGTQTIPKATLPTGSVLQVVNATYGTVTSSVTATRADTGLSATITPLFNTSKILVSVNMVGCGKGGGNAYMAFWLMRGATDIIKFEGEGGYTANSDNNSFGSCSTTYLDSPATTSATTYKIQFNNVSATGSVSINNSSTSTITLMEIAV